MTISRLTLLLVAFASLRASDTLRAAAPAASPAFERDVAPILERRCLECHGAKSEDAEPKGSLSLTTRAAALTGGESGPALVPGKPAESLLIDLVSLDKTGHALMPKKRDPLKPAEIDTLTRWIAAGAPWPAEVVLRDRRFEGYKWWSLEPIVRPAVPQSSGVADVATSTNPIDAFVRTKLAALKLAPSPEADRRTLIRRLYFDLIGLPPTPQEIEAFTADKDPAAYDKLVDRLLASPHYGERWARHWLDVVHFGETHGYDKDKPRPNAWPYRDYVIRSFNDDKPYSQFIEEQLAGDVLHRNTRDGLEALGFISAGPWDFIGHAEVPETKLDGKVARHIDRDDMSTNAMQTFAALTVQCAQCHDHKFDPITQEDYYSLQAVFAAVDRADKRYDVDPAVAEQRKKLLDVQTEVRSELEKIERAVAAGAGPELAKLDAELAALRKPPAGKPQKSDAYGYHSAIAPQQATDDAKHAPKWVQVDLGKSVPIGSIVLHPCRDSFAGIGDGFGFPVRYRVDISDDAEFKTGVTTVADYTGRDVPKPGIQAQAAAASGQPARYVRVTATKLALRQNDYIFALAELEVFAQQGTNVAAGKTVTSLDSIEAGPRWGRKNLVDGYYPGVGVGDPDELAALTKRRNELFDTLTTPLQKNQLAVFRETLGLIPAELAKLPPQQTCYIAAVHTGTGNFAGTGAMGGKPRPIFVLARGNVATPQKEVGPGAISGVTAIPARFALAAEAGEGERRAALARWFTDPKNPLTWRVIVNRVWQYHFGRGIVDSPNDFGRNGREPTHPELLDWLAAEFRDGGSLLKKQSLKSLHRLIVTSATYRQTTTAERPIAAGFVNAAEVDVDNRYLWRANRRRIDAEALRDSVLAVSGLLDRAMYGPSFQDFVVVKPEHSPHYEYHLHDPTDPKSHRRSIYRFIVRSQPQPFMTTFDCADPSMQVDKRNESLSPLQALTLLNNGLTVVAAERFAAKLATSGDLSSQVQDGFQQATGRRPTANEQAALATYAKQHGLPATCRVIFNLNEFFFID
jgi:mono/diheme cytochrome c family protein